MKIFYDDEDDIIIDAFDYGEQPESLTSEDIYNATYQAIIDSNKEIKKLDSTTESRTSDSVSHVIIDNTSDFSDVNVTNYSDFDFSEIPVAFATPTDSTFYTVQPSVQVSSADEQMVAYALDTRNICLLFFLTYIVIIFYKLIRNTVIKFVKGKGESI